MMDNQEFVDKYQSKLNKYGSSVKKIIILLKAIKRNDIEFVRFLLDNVKDLDVNDTPYNWKPVELASNNGNQEIIKLLIQHGASINDTSVFYDAVEKNDIEFVRFLLDNVKDLDVNDTPYNWKPVEVASNNGSQELVKLLLNIVHLLIALVCFIMQ